MSIIRFTEAKTLQEIMNVSSMFQMESKRKLNHIKVKECIDNYDHVLAYDEDKLIGFIYANEFAPDILEIYNMFIHPDYRNQGIGTLMLQHFINNMDEKYQGIIVINSSLYDQNEKFISAVTFYNMNNFNLIAMTDNSSVLYYDTKVDHEQII